VFYSVHILPYSVSSALKFIGLGFGLASWCLGFITVAYYKRQKYSAKT